MSIYQIKLPKNIIDLKEKIISRNDYSSHEVNDAILVEIKKNLKLSKKQKNLPLKKLKKPKDHSTKLKHGQTLLNLVLKTNLQHKTIL